MNARLFDFPPERTPGKRGRIALKGQKLMNFKQMLAMDNLPWQEVEITLYIDRWSLEVTFEESREHLGVETQRQWSDKAIARSTPVLLRLYSLVCLIANQMGQSAALPVEETACYRKDHATFSDLLRAVRMAIWRDNLFLQKGKIGGSVENIPPEMQEWAQTIVKCLLQAA